MSELVKRTLSGIVFVACIVGCILWSQWAVMGLLLFVSMMAVDEFHRLVKSHILQRICAGLGVLVLWFLTVCLTYEHPDGDLSALVFPVLMAYLPIMIVALLDEIWNRSEMPLAHWGNMLISQAMIALPLLTMMVLYRLFGSYAVVGAVRLYLGERHGRLLRRQSDCQKTARQP